MSGRVLCGVIPRALLACAHHPKMDDLSSISCLLSMRLYRHANNRKFALRGIDQQPLTLNHDSEVSHDSGASERTEQAGCFVSVTPGKPSYHWDPPRESQLDWGWKPHQRGARISRASEQFAAENTQAEAHPSERCPPDPPESPGSSVGFQIDYLKQWPWP